MFDLDVNITAVPWQLARYDAECCWVEIETVERGDDLPEQGYTLAIVYGTKKNNPVAHLMASAPELRDALRRMMTWAGEFEELVRAAYKWTDEDQRLSDEAFRIGHIAIAHSEGRSYEWVEEDIDE